MRRLIYRGSFLVLLAVLPALAADAGQGEIRKVEVFPAGGEVRVEITLSSAVIPAVETAQHPDRLILKLPGTLADAEQKRIAVGQFGVRSIRYALNRAAPPETHLVVDLDQEHPYRLSIAGAKIILVVEAPLSASARRRSGPAPAATRPLLGSLGRRQDSGGGQPGSPSTQDSVLLTPPPSGPPIQFPAPPGDSQSAASASRASSDQPSAQHPNRASLQEGTVFPSAGSPGAGNVPPVSWGNSPSGFDTKDNQSSAKANVPPGSAQQPLPQEPRLSTGASPEAAASVRQDANISLPSSSGQSAAAVSVQSVPAAPPTVAQNSAQNAVPAAAGHGAAASGKDSSSAQTAAAPVPPTSAVASLPAVENKPVSPASTQPDVALAPTPKPAETAAQVAAAQSGISGQNAATVPEPPASGQTAAEGSGEGRFPQLMTRPGENPGFRTAFRVKYVAQDAAYLEGGRAAGLADGMKLVVRDLPNAGAVAAEGADSSAAGDVAELEVMSVAETSAVTEIHTPKRPVKVGDLAYLSSADQQALVEKNALSATRKYPAVVSFTENDTLDDEARAEVPKPPLPSVNRARGRIGFDYIGVLDHGGSGMHSSNLGMVLRADITRINGTYWNVSGYWRGRFNSTAAGPQTLQDLINRTYHLYTSYENPRSSWVAGFGRMYLPWATSLDTIDGGYFGRKLKTGVTTGLFLGSTPDPTSYSYNPQQEIGGAFVNFEGGSYDDLHYTSTSGGGMSMLKWSPERPFLFTENGIFYKRVFSLYQASQIDSRQGYWYLDPTKNTNVWQPGTGWGPGRSFVTARFQPHPRIEFSFNHTYFRDMPTFAPALIGTGLLDKYLFQGFSAGTRVEVHKQIWISTDLGLSSRSGDKKGSLNQMYGITFGHVPWINAHADLRYSRFNSAFGSGSYEAFSLSKNLGETLQLQVLAGQQNFASTLTSATRSRFLNGMVETALGQHYFIQAGGTISRGGQMSYDQWLFTFGYRFDNRHGHRGQ
ncbi:MAG: AMIN domain-containing protein [Terriglobales bacterium]